MSDNMTVFCFAGYFDSDPTSVQYRYVLAASEDEATQKLQEYADNLEAMGFDRFVSPTYPIVEIEGVIA